MNVKTARAILRCQGAHQIQAPDRLTQSALKVIAKTPEISDALSAQVAADAVALEKVSVDVPADLIDAMTELSERLSEPVRRSAVSIKNPAFLAVALAFMAMIGVGVWLLMIQMEGFRGMEETISLAEIGDLSEPSQFEPLDAPAGTLGDWFVMQGFDGFRVPTGFESYQVVGVRTFDFEGTAVAMAVVPENRAFFYVFPSRSLGIVPGASGNWRILEYGPEARQRALGITQTGDFCFMISFQGNRAAMEEFIRKSESQ